MRRPVTDDVIAVLEEIRRRFELSSLRVAVQDLRKQAIRSIAQTEVDAGRFANEKSAVNSIHDACGRRLRYAQIERFDADVENWLNWQPDALREAILATVTTEEQRQRLVEVLGISDSQPWAPLAQDLDVPPTERVETTTSRIVRDTRLSARVKKLHNYECQLCGCTLPLTDGSRYAEGHHIQPLGAPHNGPDILENIICVCPNHHAMCDLGAIRLALPELRQAEGHSVDQGYIDYHNSCIYPGRNRAEQGAVSNQPPE